MKTHCIIVDDEPIAHKILGEYLAATPDMIIAGNFYNTIDASAFMERHSVDLLFLDVRMPVQNGIAFLKTLKEKPVTILVTALLDHALEAYDLDVIDYLVKPIRPERFTKALQKAMDFLLLRSRNFVMSESSPAEKKYLTIKSGREIVEIAVDTISHVQALKDYMFIYVPGNKYIIRSTVINILNRLPNEKFVRVHKSFIVNRSFIKRVTHSGVEIEGFTIPLGNHYKQALI